jgi:predicted NAD/FAD-dependent oxidoreductase
LVALFKDDNKEIKDKLAQVKYSSRFAVGLFYPTSITNLNIPWRIYYVDKTEHDCLRFLAVDNAKRNKSKLLIVF